MKNCPRLLMFTFQVLEDKIIHNELLKRRTKLDETKSLTFCLQFYKLLPTFLRSDFFLHKQVR